MTGDLKTVVDKLKLFLNGQYVNYDGDLEESKTRMPQDLRRMSIFRDLYGFVTPFALRKICDHYKRICGQPTAIEPCTGIFTRTMGLPCAHKIQERLYNRADGGVLKLQDIHRHWLYTKPPRAATARAEEQEDNTMGGHQGGGEGDDEHIEMQGTPSPPQILQIQEPAIVRAKGRPPGSQNRLWAGVAPSQPTASQRRRQQAFEDSTQRQPSGFELTPELPSSQVPDSQSQSQRGGPQRGGRGGRQRGGRGGRQRGGRGGAEGQIGDVPASYMGSFQM